MKSIALGQMAGFCSHQPTACCCWQDDERQPVARLHHYHVGHLGGRQPGGCGQHQGSLASQAKPQAAHMSTMIQVAVAFFVAGLGNVGAGLILDYVKEWPVFLHVDELFVLVPSLLGLKGNLEMTMASRLSTQANLGHMDNLDELIKIAKGNLALVQVQATVVSFLVALFASFVKYLSMQQADVYEGIQHLASAGQQANLTAGNTIGLSTSMDAGHIMASMGPRPGFDWNNALVVCASSLLTANLACFVLGTMMILVIVCSHRCRIDPDNIASPVAASLGDMITATLLAVLAHAIYHYTENQRFPYLALVITLLFLGMLPVWVSVASSNPYTSSVIVRGWTPIVIAVFISSCGGFILDYGKSRFSRLPVFQPVVNGLGGNLVAVQASRLSTALHKEGKPGELPPNFRPMFSPIELFLTRRGDQHLITARILLLISVPAHLFYFYLIRSMEGETAIPVTSTFLGLYLAMALLQVAILLYMAQNLVILLWRRSIDPDNYSTPLLTATGDLLGCAFLLIVFIVAYQLSDPYALTAV